MERVTWVERAYCPICEAAIWSDETCASIRCICGGAEIQGDVVVLGDPVTDETAFTRQAADDVGEPVRNVEIVRMTR